jgi:hypothetical protein
MHNLKSKRFGKVGSHLKSKRFEKEGSYLKSKRFDKVGFCRINQVLISRCQCYFYIGTRLGPILHVRLRMQCSSLNHHLFRKYTVNSPFCQCGATETTKCANAFFFIKFRFCEYG